MTMVMGFEVIKLLLYKKNKPKSHLIGGAFLCQAHCLSRLHLFCCWPLSFPLLDFLVDAHRWLFPLPLILTGRIMAACSLLMTDRLPIDCLTFCASKPYPTPEWDVSGLHLSIELGSSTPVPQSETLLSSRQKIWNKTVLIETHWDMHVISALGKLRQEHHEFKASLDYIVAD